MKYVNENKRKAEQKNRELQQQLEKSRGDFCGIGTRKIKLFLNKKIKEGDIIAKLYRMALEIEDKNITAKKIMNKYHGYGYEYADKVYAEKHKLIRELIGLCIDNDIIYGYQVCDDISTNAIIYFELPNMEQISFHDSMSKEEIEKWNIYLKEWDGKKNSTLRKIEKTILEKYKNDLK